MTKKLENKTALVTGASKGIGAAIAIQLAKEGAKVIVNFSSDKAGAERVVKEIEKIGSEAEVVKANLSIHDEIKTIGPVIQETFGKLDILVNNAGIYETSTIEEITSEHFRKLFDINVLGLLLITQEALKHFNEAGGSIINISSVAAHSGVGGFSVYSATKGAVDSLTRALAHELGPRQIRVNAINPGMIETEGLIAAGFHDSPLKKKFEQETPLRRLGKPFDVAPLAAFLASDEASWITGETFVISGGYK